MSSSYLHGRKVSIVTLWALTSAAVAAAVYHRGVVKGNAVRKRGGASRSGVGDEGIAEAESVLSFWFGGSTADNHRMKWFAQGENVPRVDAAILEQFSSLVLRAQAGELTSAWSCHPRYLLALILLLDQFPRHLFRHYPDRDARVAACDRQALPLTETMLERNWQEQLTAEEHVFALMPLRHTPSEERLQRVMDEIEAREKCLQQSKELLQRFKKATNRRLQTIQDMAEEGAEILEHFEFQPKDESEMSKHQLVRVLRIFLDERGGVASDRQRGSAARHRTPVPAAAASTHAADARPGLANGAVADGGEGGAATKDASGLSTSPGGETVGGLKHVAVSLSGGVDSMALCRALVYLRPLYGFEVMGIHIDYGNRQESGREADFVEGWCARHGVAFYKRAIDEVRRDVTARDEYEKVAREIRFSAYKAALEGKGSPGNPAAVMFGHHENDVEENVLTNLIKGCSILGLAGMLPENVVNGVRVWRPMLPFGKDVVLDFAHRFGVPYFKDTTPSWSTRGKLRRQLVPMLEEVFGNEVMSHLSSVARESDNLRELVYRELFQPVWDKADSRCLGVRLEVEPFRGHGMLFWKEILRHIVHSMGMPMVRDKTLGMFVREVLQRDGGVNPVRDGWVELRKEYSGLLHDGYLYILREGVFLSPGRSYGEEADGTPVPLDGASVDVGPWRITTKEGQAMSTEEVQSCERGRPPAINTPPFRSIEELMEGKLTYVVALPDTADVALTVQPGATAKAPAWRNVDPRIRRALPVVATVQSTLAPPALAEAGARIITVNLEYTGDRREARISGGKDGGQKAVSS